MNKKLQLTIAEPCHENWESMSPVEKGKYCGSCQKQVIDFTSMSDRQLAEFFKKPSTGSVCGRFMTDQLDREIIAPSKRKPWLKYFFSILLPAFLASKASAQKMGSVVKFAPKDTSRVPITNEFRTLGMVLPKNIMGVEKEKKDDLITKNETKPDLVKKIISGIVMDEFGFTVPFATITNGEKDFSVISNEKGLFNFPVSSLTKDSILITSAVGYDTIKTKVGLKSDASDPQLIISLKLKSGLDSLKKSCPPTIRMGAVAYGVPVLKVEPTEFNLLSPTLSTGKKIIVYSNPVKSGSNLVVGWNTIEEGTYVFQLLNMAGQAVTKKELKIESGAKKMLQTSIPKVAAGIYIIVFTNKKTGNKYTEQLSIQ